MSLLTWEDLDATTAARASTLELAIKPHGKTNQQRNTKKKTSHDTSASNITRTELGRLNEAKLFFFF